ncbi:hypothetical protein [Natrialba sp. SSL1]|uniref:hypothetical protein n=1 Tax=Natrialba sp. SSL1 TaxID=1869245 RepID=UPI0008F84058|nr:hypothetical protein [Natrialba sp. SSL1]OIB56135.1 hypothetical protein BBD46_19190 [Natrialba sp. SSL1]
MTNHRGPSPIRAPPGPSIEEDDGKGELENEGLLRAICSKPGVDHLVPDEDESDGEFYDNLFSDVDADPPIPLEEQDDD